MRPPLFIAACCLAANCAAGGESSGDAEPPSDFQVHVVLDAAEQSGSANAVIHIHATRETVWSLITSCPEALNLVPGLVACEVLASAPDRSWQTIRHVMNYSWYVPKLTYEIRASYDPPMRAVVKRVSGDLKTLNVSWTLRADGEYTVAEYSIDLVPGFWVPRWLVRIALRHDLPKMLRALRTRAETIQQR